MAIKLDMSKAYDRVELDFLEKVMSRLGFLNGWIHRIMSFVTMVSFSSLVNGRVCVPVIPSRGLR
ncbi:hypothetical protein Dsin_028884 [Dipteronia sinensis]|uniref:Reverse transcriptase n=1 Tax=Dipteronia sinensis TaxID=43782 RepID=A0AAE0DUP1_9ROSI|nr:hypothetical protein Dsin_028884 [Dipteronia sinensis]